MRMYRLQSMFAAYLNWMKLLNYLNDGGAAVKQSVTKFYLHGNFMEENFENKLFMSPHVISLEGNKGHSEG